MMNPASTREKPELTLASLAAERQACESSSHGSDASVDLDGSSIRW